MLYMVTFTINIPPMLAYIPYMDPVGLYLGNYIQQRFSKSFSKRGVEVVLLYFDPALLPSLNFAQEMAETEKFGQQQCFYFI